MQKIKRDSVSFPIKLTNSPKSWAKSLGDTGFDSINIQKNSLTLKKAHSYDFSGNPHLLTKITLSKNKMQIEYTHDNKNPKAIQLLTSTKLALLCLSALKATALSPEFYSLIYKTLDYTSSSISLTNAQLEHKNQELEKSLEELREKNQSLHIQRENDSKRMLAAAKKLSELKTQLSKLKNTPDSMVDELVLNWLGSHGSEICISDFCKQHNVPPARVEQSLDRLSKASKIKRI